MNLTETKISSEPVFNGTFVSIARDTVRLPNGKESKRVVVRHPGAACVLAVTASNEVVFVRQWRYATGQPLLEIPAGKLDDNEDPAVCALRELAEEFGLHLSPDRLEAAFTFPNPRWAGRYSVFFTGQITQAEIAAIRFGGEGQGWRMMPLAEYLIHPKAVPHFPAQIAHCLGLPSP